LVRSTFVEYLRCFGMSNVHLGPAPPRINSLQTGKFVTGEEDPPTHTRASPIQQEEAGQ
jgi:hypothetical protein